MKPDRPIPSRYADLNPKERRAFWVGAATILFLIFALVMDLRFVHRHLDPDPVAVTQGGYRAEFHAEDGKQAVIDLLKGSRLTDYRSDTATFAAYKGRGESLCGVVFYETNSFHHRSEAFVVTDGGGFGAVDFEGFPEYAYNHRKFCE